MASASPSSGSTSRKNASISSSLAPSSVSIASISVEADGSCEPEHHADHVRAPLRRGSARRRDAGGTRGWVRRGADAMTVVSGAARGRAVRRPGHPKGPLSCRAGDRTAPQRACRSLFSSPQTVRLAARRRSLAGPPGDRAGRGSSRPRRSLRPAHATSSVGRSACASAEEGGSCGTRRTR